MAEKNDLTDLTSVTTWLTTFPGQITVGVIALALIVVGVISLFD